MASQPAETHVGAAEPAPADQTVHGRRFAVREITPSDLMEFLRRGLDDFNAQPSHLLVFALVYPAGAVLGAGLAFGGGLVPMLYPIVSGFALMGPFAGLLLYEISRRRENGVPYSWGDTRSTIMGASTGPLLLLGAILFIAFVIWITVAQAIFDATIEPANYTLFTFLNLVFTTPEGFRLIIVGNAVGFVFAAAVLATNIVSFPLLLDCRTNVPTAIKTSLRVTAKNPVTVALWGLIVGASMAVATAFLLVGLAVVIPVLGHASWHLYRKAVVVSPDMRRN